MSIGVAADEIQMWWHSGRKQWCETRRLLSQRLARSLAALKVFRSRLDYMEKGAPTLCFAWASTKHPAVHATHDPLPRRRGPYVPRDAER